MVILTGCKEGKMQVRVSPPPPPKHDFFKNVNLSFIPLFFDTEDRVGFWKYYFTVHMNEKMNKLLPEKFTEVDLDFDYTV